MTRPARGLAAFALLLLTSGFALACTGPSDSDEDEAPEATRGARAAQCGSAAPVERGGPLTLGFIAVRIEFVSIWGERLCDGDCDKENLWIRQRHGIIASVPPGGGLSLKAVYTDAPTMCRGTCGILDSHYEVASGNPFCDGQAELLEDGEPVTFAVERAALPAPLAARWRDPWAYSRAVLGAGSEWESFEWTGVDDEESGEDELDAYDAGDIESYLRLRLRHLVRWQIDDVDERWDLEREPSMPPVLVSKARLPPDGLSIGALEPAVDLTRLLTGLVLRLNADARVALPATETVALAIADAGYSREMAARLRRMILDPDLDPYNRIRAGAVLTELLQTDPELRGSLGASPLIGYSFTARAEQSLLEGAMLLDAPEEAWASIVVPYASDDDAPDDVFRGAVRASLASLRPAIDLAAEGPARDAAHLFR